METLSWLAALALLGTPAAPAKTSPAQDSLPPTQRAEDRPAHESPYSAFGSPHARREVKHRSRARLHCADGTIQTSGQKGVANPCDTHGGVKK